MKFSVIVPVYNTEEYLAECVESVLNQTYPQYELILINDGSADGSGTLCNRYADSYPEKIIAIHTENQGPLPARIRGIREAGGDILVFLDSDDCLRTDALELLARRFEEQHCDMVLYNAEKCTDFASKEMRYPYSDGQYFEGQSLKTLYRMMVTSQISNSLCLKAVKRRCALLPADMSAFSHVRHGEDLLLSAYLITNCSKIVYLNQGLYHYRVREGSLVHAFSEQRAESIKTVHKELERFLDIWGIPELKPKHNARKVRGWIQNLGMLLDNKEGISDKVFRNQLEAMAEDPYFAEAYLEMDVSCLTSKQRILAALLYRKKYQVFSLLACVKRWKNRFPIFK